jgi:hypothetical protein
VQVRNDLARSQKETAAGHECFAIRVLCCDSDDSRLYAFYEVGEIFICVRNRD